MNKQILGPNWFLTHKPQAPVHYNPLPSEFAEEYPGDLCGLGGEFDTGVQLRAVHRATRTEQAKLERSYR